MGGGFNSFILVRCREVRRNNKINEEGGPINPKKGDQRVLEDVGQRWDGNKFLLPPPPMAIDALLPSQR
jgi:hypothetical protein